MSQLQFNEAVERITYLTPAFPQEEFDVIRRNYDKAKPLFYEALAYAYSNPEDVPEQYQLHFYALLFFGEFQEKDAFEKIMEFLTLPSDLLDLLLGDYVTDGLQDVIYNTYNGNLKLLKNMILNHEICVYARNDMLAVMGQLYFDGVLAKEEWINFLREIIKEQVDRHLDEIGTWVSGIICKCHLAELLPDVRMLYENHCVDLCVYGEFDRYVDDLFRYRGGNEQNEICQSPMSADQIKTWVMFEQQPKKPSKADLQKWHKEFSKAAAVPKQAKKVKVSRNDPCPCGSGKKYKFCCMNKPKEAKILSESEEQRKIWLRNYPLVGEERLDGRVYLEDYYDQESIETDQLIYLALNRHSISIYHHTVSAEDLNTIRKQEYLLKAFSRFKNRMETEQIPAVADYDRKYSIHYMCRAWMAELADLLKGSEYDQIRNEVLTYCHS